MPLVATSFQFRRQGMCRVLMCELEKVISSCCIFWHAFRQEMVMHRWRNKWLGTFFSLQLLVQLGVERLILPAASQVRTTWEASFGFLEMPISDRQELLGYPLLGFQGTTMIQKYLRRSTCKATRGTYFRILLLPSPNKFQLVNSLLHVPCSSIY